MKDTLDDRNYQAFLLRCWRESPPVAGTESTWRFSLINHDGLPIKWKVENSWGTDDGDEGIFYMYDNWFDLYVVRVVIHESHIPKQLLKLTEQSPIIIPEEEPEQSD